MCGEGSLSPVQNEELDLDTAMHEPNQGPTTMDTEEPQAHEEHKSESKTPTDNDEGASPENISPCAKRHRTSRNASIPKHHVRDPGLR